MMQAWANYLDGLKNGADVIPIRRPGGCLTQLVVARLTQSNKISKSPAWPLQGKPLMMCTYRA